MNREGAKDAKEEKEEDAVFRCNRIRYDNYSRGFDITNNY
jgi:hypothetical protein